MPRVRELRAATAADGAGLARLLQAPVERCERGLGALRTLPLARTLVIGRRERLVGYLEMHARPATTNGWTAHVSSLVLDHDDAPVSLGRALVGAADVNAALLGCERIVLEPGAARAETVELAPTIGFDEADAHRSASRAVAFGSVGSPVERFLRQAARGTAEILGLVGAGAGEGPLDDPHAGALDHAADAAMLSRLETLGMPILSEESGLSGGPPAGDDFWISLDPIDGTRNCASRYAPWATAVGLVRGARPVAGLVVDLSSGRRWWAAPNLGGHVDGVTPRPRSGGLLVLPSTEPHRLPTLPASTGFTRIRLAGATSVDLCRVADGSAGAFLDLERAIAQPHDVAAAMAIVRAAGASVLDERGHAPRLEPDPDRHYRLVAAATEADARGLLAAAG